MKISLCWFVIALLVVLVASIQTCSASFHSWLKGLKGGYGYGRNYGYANNYGYSGGYNNYGYPSHHYHHQSPHSGGGHRSGRTYSDIARVVNPNQYAFVGKSPYPGQPFWPQG